MSGPQSGELPLTAVAAAATVVVSSCRYNKLNLLGAGTFGEAWLAKSVASQRYYVIKELKMTPTLTSKVFKVDTIVHKLDISNRSMPFRNVRMPSTRCQSSVAAATSTSSATRISLSLSRLPGSPCCRSSWNTRTQETCTRVSGGTGTRTRTFPR